MANIKILANFNGSLKHAYSIQFLLNICNTEYMLLLDSDVKLINELDFLNYDISKYVTISDIQLHGKIDKKKPNIIYTSHSRFLPYI